MPLTAICEALFDAKKAVGEKTLLTVSGRSMRPLIKFGDAVLVDHNAQDCTPGDVIAYWWGTRVIIHRVIKRFEVNGRIVYLGKGDANSKIDPRIAQASVLGKVRTVIKSSHRTIQLDAPFWRFMGRAFVVWVDMMRWMPRWVSENALGRKVRHVIGRLLSLVWNR